MFIIILCLLGGFIGMILSVKWKLGPFAFVPCTAMFVVSLVLIVNGQH